MSQHNCDVISFMLIFNFSQSLIISGWLVSELQSRIRRGPGDQETGFGHYPVSANCDENPPHIHQQSGDCEKVDSGIKSALKRKKMVIVTLFNFLFIGLFILLVKLIYQEITVKLSQKASGILLSSKVNFNETILILNLKQVLLVWISITMIKLGEFNPFPGKDLVLISVALASIKILNSSKEVLVADLCSGLSILMMGVVIGVRSHGSVIEPLSDLLASLALVMPLLLWLPMLFSTFLVFSFLPMKVLLPVITAVIITVVILSSVKKVQLKHTLLLLILVSAILSYMFTQIHQRDHEGIFVQDNQIKNPFYFNQDHNFSQSETKDGLRSEKMYLQDNQAVLQQKILEFRRNLLVVSYKSHEHQCELYAIDVSDQNMFVKAFFKVFLPLPRSISQFIIANGFFSSLKLQGFAKDCRALIGRQITASMLRVGSYDNQTCSQKNKDDYHSGSNLRNFVSSLLSSFKATIDHLSL